MITPNLYKVKEDVNEKQILSNGFQARTDYYKLRKALYGNTIFLNLFIDKDDYHMTVNVQDSENNWYPPFYDPDNRHDNMVYLEVVKNYNNLMDKFVDKKIFEYETEVKALENVETIKVKYHADIRKLERIEGKKSDWIDLRAAETVHLKKGEFKLISLGVSMELPKGYEAHIVPRSSTYKSYGIIQTNHQGVIDESYNGDQDIWRYPAYALRETTINKNDRICQFRIVKKQPEIYFEEVNTLGNENRGGFGSTGKN